jgi:chromosome segregation ATPase
LTSSLWLWKAKKVGFGKVIAMIEDMQEHLAREQSDDDQKKIYCEKEFDESDDQKKSKEQAVSDANTAIEDVRQTLATLSGDITSLQNEITALDKSVSEATEQRKAEHADFAVLMSSNSAAKELIKMAQNRLNKFYDPRLYIAPPKTELSEEERIAVSMGETLAPTPAPAGIAGTDITAFAEFSTVVAPPPAPAQATYAKKSAESGGVIEMLNLLVKELDQEMQTADTAEADAQRDYEQAMSDAASRRADATKMLGNKKSAKAEAQSALQAHTDDHAAHSQELLNTLQYIQSLHLECDWLLQHFDQRKAARASEVDALGKAKAVISGADFSFVQTGSKSKSLRGHM